ncbi:Vomp family autotransporter [Bartonella heixiaziensis]|uniref:Vomp family autotransporter n=1 Tax=Bartonella heixiaziensis TaxID=1461000 RepID=UPI003908BA10
MKKLYAPQAASELKRSRFSFVKVLSLATAATFLSNVTPVFSANSDFRNTFLEGVNSAGVSYPENIISVAGLNASSVSKDNYLTALNVALTPKVNAADDYANFLTKTLLGPSPSDEGSIINVLTANSNNLSKKTLNAGVQDKKPLISPQSFVVDSSADQPFAENDENATLVNVSDLLRGGNTGMQRNTRASNTVILGDGASVKSERGIAIGYNALASSKGDALAIGYMSHAMGISSVSIGSEYHAEKDPDDHTMARGDFTTAVGAVSHAEGYGATAIGHRAKGVGKESISFGFYSEARTDGAIAIGANSLALSPEGVALGKDSKADRDLKTDGYSPLLHAHSPSAAVEWKGTRGAVSVGDFKNGITRQIINVAAGLLDTDAVNVAQLKDLETLVRKNGWKLSVGDKNATTVLMDSGVDFSAGSTNLQITKGDKDNKLKFDLAKDVTLTSLKVGPSTLNVAGLLIADGPLITVAGINAGNKKITGLAEGTDDTDAVTFAQLKAAQAGQAAGVIKGLKINTTGKDFADAIADAENSVALGSKSSVSKRSSGALAFGYGASVKDGGSTNDPKGSLNGIALGANASVSGIGGVALGASAAATGESALAFGSGAKASVKDGIALGSGSVANVGPGFGGYDPSTRANSDKKDNTWLSSLGALSIGDAKQGKTRQIVGVAAGTNDSDAVNVAQLKALQDSINPSWGLSVNGKNTTDVNSTNPLDLVTGSTNLNLTKGDKDNKVQFDLAPDVTLTSLKAGTNTFDATGLVITGGPQITTAGIGAGSKKITGLAKGTDDTDAVNKGQLDENVTTLSKNIEDVRSIAVFYDVEEDTTEEVSTLTRTAPKAKQSSVTFGDPKTGTVALHNVGIGKITKDSHDAVNGSQLHTLGNEVASYFGGGAKYDGGTWTAPTFTVKTVKDDGVSEDKVYSDVASALSGVGSSITNVQNKLTEQVNNVVNKVEGESFVQQDKTTHRLTIGAKSEGSEINIANKAGTDRTLSGVQAATKDNEAVNKGQLDKGLKDLSNSLQSDESAVVHYDKGSDGKTNYSSVTLGGKDKTAVGLHNVADGKIAKGSHDAITGGQVNTIGEDVAKFLGGDAAFTNGALTQPTYKLSHIATDGGVTESSFQGVGTAFAGLDTNIKNVNARIKEVSEGVAHDSLLWSDTAHAFVAQHEKKEEKDGKVVVTQENSKITFLAAGKITADSTDAINGSQFHSLGNNVATYFGGSATFADGAFTAPTYKISNVAEDGKATEKSYNDVGSAFAGLDASVKNVNTHLTNEIKNFTEKVTNITQAVQGDALLWNDKSHAFVAQHEKKEEKDDKVVVTQENSKITFLAAGDITKDSTDAVNGSQIYSMSEMVGSYFGGGAGYNKEGKWIAPTFKVKQIGSDGHITDETYQNVADAFSSVGNSFESVHNEINTMRSDSLVKWNEEKKLIKIGGEKDGTTITVADKDSKDRILSGVKDAEKGNEAVNKAQLDKNIDALTNEIEEVRSVAVFYDEEEDTEEVSTLTRTAPKAKQSNVTFGDPKTGPVGLHNVGTGKIAKDSHDAINGSQLFETNDKVATYLGGGSAFKEGSLTAPTYKISNITDNGTVTTSSYNDVGSAFAGLDASVKNVNTHLTNEVKNFTDKVTNITQKFKGDALLWSDTAHAFVAQHEKKEEKEDNTVVVTQENSKITSLAAGAISETSTDAVNGSQLHTLGTGVATFLGGGAVYKDGKWTAPTFKVKTIKEDGTSGEGDYSDVASAFAGVGSSITNVKNEITKQINNEIANVKGDSLVKKDATTNLITIGKEVEGSEINIANKAGTDRTLSGVQAATKDNEAVNKGQLEKGLKDLSNSLQSDESAVVHYDKGSDGKTNYSSVTLGGKDKTAVGLHNVADGKIAKGSHDAITGGQVNTIGEDVAKFLGGDAAFTNGALTQPTYKLSHIATDGVVTESSFQGVGTAFAGLDTNIKNVNARIKEVSEGVAHDSLLWSDTAHAFVAQHEKKEEKDDKVVVTQENSKITFLAAGDITKDSTDAVNGSQIYSMSEMVGSYFGGGAGYNNEGKWIAPTFKVKQIGSDGHITDETYQNVADAFSSVGNSFESVHNEINTMRSDSLVKWNEEKKLIKIGGEKDGTTITVADKDSKDRILSGVKDAEKGNEAVNKAQLDKNIDALTNEIEEVRSVAVFYDEEEDTEEVSTLTRTAPKAKQSNVTFGDPKTGPVGLHNVGTGKIAKDSHDAINGSQLFETNDKVATYLGGGSAFKEGSLTAPTYKISNITDNGTVTTSSYNDVGSAFAGLDASVKNVNTHLTNEVKNFTDKVTNITQKFKGDALLWSDTAHAFVAQHEKKEEKEDNTVVVTQENSKITSLAAGAISETSTDAVNGSQLHTLGTGVATFLGGGAVYKDGKWTAPTFKVKTIKEDGTSGEGDYSDVASAFAGVGSSITNVKNEITKQINNEIANVKGDSLVKKDATTNLITIGKEVEGSEINIANKAGTDRTLSGVQAATKDNEAVNKGQLEKGLKDLSNSLQSDESAVVHYDKGSDGKTNYSSVTLGGKDKTAVGLHNVADGKIAKGSHDAITGGQVNTIGEDVAKFLGGDAAFTNGALTQPTYKLSHIATDGVVTESSFQGVGTAFAGLDTNIKNVNARIKEVSEGVAHDSLLWSDTAHAFVAQHEKKEEKDDKVVVTQENSKITFLAAGDITKDSTDAVNGSQIYSMSEMVGSYFGGGAGYNNEGKWIAPTFKVKQIGSDGHITDETYQNVADAFSSVGNSFESVHNEINTMRSDSLVKWNEEKKLIKIGGEKDGTTITVADKDSKARTLSGVKDAEKDDEAVNKAQLDRNVDALTNEINDVRSVAVFYDTEEDTTEEVGTLTRSTPKAKQNSVTFGDPSKGQVGLHNVAAGKIAKDSHDAVNGDQLHSLGDKAATYFGGSATFADGALTAPTYKISNVAEDGTATEKPYNDVGSAFAGLDTSVKNVNTHLTNVENKFTQKIDDISKEVKGDALLWNDKVHAFVAQHGEGDAKANSKLTSLLDGAINDSSTDAVTGNQLHKLGTGVAKSLGGNASYAEGKWSAPTFTVKSVKEDGKTEDKDYHDVATAFAGVGTSFSNVNNSITNIKKEVTKEIADAKSDSLNWSKTANAFVAQHEKKEKDNEGKVVVTQENSKITSLQAGKITADSTDAVNGSQLYSLGSEVAKSLGGGAGYANGTWTAPSFVVSKFDAEGKATEEKYDDVAAAFAGVSSSITNIHNEVNKEINKVVGDSLVKQDKDADPITIGKETDGTVINVANKSGVKRVISGVDDAKDNNDAVNKGQLEKGLKDLSNSLQSDESAVVHYDKQKDGKVDYANVTLGKAKDKTAVGLHNVADGKIAKGSHDAITGGQVNTIGEDVAKFLGGDAAFTNGALTQPTYKLSHIATDGVVTESSFQGVGTAFAGLDTNIKNVNARIKEVSEGVAHDSLLWSDTAHAFVAQHEKKEEQADGTVVVTQENSKITSLQAGKITADSTDAVNGSQLYSLGSEVAKSLGGGAGYAEGKWTAPTFTVKSVKDDGVSEDKVYSDVASALSGVGSSITNVQNKLTEQVNNVVNKVESESFVQQDKTTHLLTIGAKSEGGEINIANKDKGDRILSGVQAATKDNEAVNKGQLEKGLTDLSNSLQSDESAVVHYDKQKDGKVDYANVTFGGKDKTAVGLHNIADGKIAKDSRDAITGGQINIISQEVAKFLGGNAAFKDGALSAPTYKISNIAEDGTATENSYNDVGSAFAGLDTNFKNVNTHLTNVVNEFTEKVTNITQEVQGDALLWNKDQGAFVAQHEKREEGDDGKVVVTQGNSKITSLAAGKITADSTDAVNGSQIYSMSEMVGSYFGGGAGYDKEGKWIAPTFTIKTVKDDGTEEEKKYNTVAEAFAGVGTSFTNVKNDITNVVSNSLVKWNEEQKIIKIGGEKEGGVITLADNKNTARTLSGVKDAEKNDEAVNKGQLDENVTKLSDDIEEVRSVAVLYDEEEASEEVSTLTRSAPKVNKNSVTFGDPKTGTVALHNVAAGKIVKDSHDVINGGQIETITQNVAKFLGGDTAFSDGAFTGPTYKLSKVSTEGEVAESEFKDVGTAFAGLDTNIKNVNQRIKEVSEGVAQDSLLWSDTEKAFVAQHGKDETAKTNSKIKFLANGEVSESSTEAVNGSQLYSLNTTLAKYFGGNAKYENGAWTAPTFKVKTVNDDGTKVEDKDYSTVAEAFAGVGTSFTNIHNEINKEIDKVVGDSLVKQDAETKVIQIGGEKEGTAITVANSKGDARSISGVKAGNLSEGSTEAVNGSQLYSLNTTLAKYFGGNAKYENGAWTAPTFKVKTVNDDGTKVEDKDYSTVAEAFAGVGTSFTNIHNEINKEIDKVVGDSLVKQDAETKVIQIGGEKEGTAITVANSKGDARSISGVKAGNLSEGSTEAVNGSQLYSLNTTLAKYFGGNAKYENGAWTAPTFKVKTVNDDGTKVEDKDYSTVAEAFAGVGTSFTNIHNEINKEIDKVVGDSLVKQDAETKVIQIGGEKEGTAITVANSKGDARSISGVKAGNLSEGSTEAVNGSQLYSLNTTLAKYFGGNAKYENGAWTAPTFKVKTVNDDGTKVEDKDYSTVAEAFAGVGTSFTNIHNEINKEIDKVVGDSLVKQDAETKVIQIGGEKEGTAITVANSKGDARSISGVKAGNLSEGSTEAVNGSQLYSLNTTLAKYFGGNAKYENGAWTAPTFKVTTFNDDGSPAEQEYESVAAAFAGVSSSFTKLHNEISDNIEQNALLWSDEESAFVALHGKEDARSKSKLKSLLDGDISEGSTEAMTGNQLYLMSNQLSAYFGGGAGYKAGEWTAPTFNVAQFNSDGSSSEKKSYHDVASAFDGVSDSMSSINERIKEVSDNRDTNSLNWNEDKGSYDASHKGASSKITNVAGGKIEEGSQEVVNGGQLWTVNEKVKEVETKVDTIDQQVKDITTAVTDGAVNYDKDADGKKTNSITLAGGNESEPVLIANVKDGKIEEGSKQAVNGGQLHDYTDQQMKIVLEDAKKYTDDQVNGLVNNGVNEAKSYTDMKFETLNYAIEDVRKEARQAAAIGLAVSNLRYYDIPGSLSVSFGSGLWRSQSAFALGAGYTSEDGNIRSNLSVTSAGGHWGIGAGITLRLR